MRKIVKPIFVRNGFFVETYNIIFDVKKLKDAFEMFDYSLKCLIIVLI